MAPAGHSVGLYGAIAAERPQRLRGSAALGLSGRLCLRCSPPRSPGAAPQPAARSGCQREGEEPATPAGTARPAPAAAPLPRGAAGLRFPARPAPRRSGRPGKMAAPVSPLVTARCLLRASARRAARPLPARAAGLRRGQCRRGIGLGGERQPAGAPRREGTAERPREPARPSPPRVSPAAELAPGWEEGAGRCPAGGAGGSRLDAHRSCRAAAPCPRPQVPRPGQAGAACPPTQTRGGSACPRRRGRGLAPGARSVDGAP